MVTLTLVAALLVAVLAWRASRADAPAPGRLLGALESRTAVIVVFAVTFVMLWCAWAAWSPIPTVHDEMAYVLQSQIFARGRWTIPSPALPLFFEQPYVLVEPALASKYFPGHSLLLTIGALVGWPALMPLMLQGGAACLLFVLARRVANGAVALLAWGIWLTSPIVLANGPTFYSEATTTVCWLAGWYALLEWRAGHRLPWLLAVAVCTGWIAITRPLTAVAYAIPIALVVVHDVGRQRRWRDLALAMGVGIAVLAIIPLWSAKTTGDWRLTPLMLYTRSYMPYDLPGFGLITTPPTRVLNAEFLKLNDVFIAFHLNHYPSTLLGTFLSRVHFLAAGVWGLSRNVYMVFALLGLLTLTRVTAFAVASSVLLLLVYLSFGTPSTWTLYYYESVAAYAYLTAAGMAWTAARVGRRRRTSHAEPGRWRSPEWAPALVAGALMLWLPGLAALRTFRWQHERGREHLTRFERVMRAIPDERAVLFVRYGPAHSPHHTFVRNSADPAAQRLWVVYDRGAKENARLLALAPDRVPYLFDEERNVVQRGISTPWR